jgi:hypothetical protein
VDQRHPLVAAQGAREAIDRAARAAGEVQQANKPLYRAFLLEEELRLLYQLEDPSLAPSPRRLAELGVPLAAGAVRQARPHHPPPPRRDPRRDPPRTQQRPTRGIDQPHPADQPPKLRLPLSQPPHRPRLPLLLRRPHPPPQVTLTTERTGAPFFGSGTRRVAPRSPATRGTRERPNCVQPEDVPADR